MAKHRQRRNRRASSAKQTTRKRRRSPSRATARHHRGGAVDRPGLRSCDQQHCGQSSGATRGLPPSASAGSGDPAAANIPNKLNRHVVPNRRFHLHSRQLPCGIAIDNSVAAGVPVLDQTIKAIQSCGDSAGISSCSSSAIRRERSSPRKYDANLCPTSTAHPPPRRNEPAASS